jgi:hypothetical protein
VDLDPGRVVAAEAQAGVAEPDLHGVAERGEPDHLKLFSFEHAEVEEPLDQRWITLERQDAAPLAGPELVEGRHVVTP